MLFLFLKSGGYQNVEFPRHNDETICHWSWYTVYSFYVILWCPYQYTNCQSPLEHDVDASPMINGTPFEYINTALAIAWVSVTMTKSTLFKPFRDSLSLASVKKLFNCPYCLAPWITIPLAYYFGFGIFAVIGLSAIFSLPMLIFLEKLDATGT